MGKCWENVWENDGKTYGQMSSLDEEMPTGLHGSLHQVCPLQTVASQIHKSFPKINDIKGSFAVEFNA